METEMVLQSVSAFGEDIAFVKGLRNNGYSYTCGETDYVGIVRMDDWGKEALVTNVYTRPIVGRSSPCSPGSTEVVELNDRRFQLFNPTVSDIDLYFSTGKIFLESDRGPQSSRNCRSLMGLMLSYKVNVLNTPFNDEQRGLLDLYQGDKYLSEEIINGVDSFFGHVRKDKSGEHEPEKSISIDIGSIVNQENLDGIITEMISKIDKKRMLVLFSLAITGRERSTFLKDKSIVDKYLRDWAIAKAPFYVLFGRNLTVGKYIETAMSGEDFADVLNGVLEKYPQAIGVSEYISSRVGIGSIMNNSLPNGWARDSLYQRIAPEIAAQTKFTQIINRLFGSHDIDSALSEIYAYTSVKTTMQISIDPYDYLTMSLNQHGWRSCHRINGGEYSAGPFSYMIDTSTLIAFANNGREYSYDINKFKWRGNSKRWRQCIHVHLPTSSAIFSREYPNMSDDMTRAIRSLYEDTVSRFFNVDNSWKLTFKPRNIVKATPGSDYAFDDINNSDARKAAISHSSLPVPVSMSDDSGIIRMGETVHCVMCYEKLAMCDTPSPVCQQCYRIVERGRDTYGDDNSGRDDEQDNEQDGEQDGEQDDGTPEVWNDGGNDEGGVEDNGGDNREVNPNPTVSNGLPSWYDIPPQAIGAPLEQVDIEQRERRYIAEMEMAQTEQRAQAQIELWRERTATTAIAPSLMDYPDNLRATDTGLANAINFIQGLDMGNINF